MSIIDWVESGRVPDTLVRVGIRKLLAQRLRDEHCNDPVQQYERFKALIEQLRHSDIAIDTDKANEQHYEIPAAFYDLVLGKYGKYSSGWWPDGVNGLDEAEERMLSASCEHADLADGQDILELGCGWGSLTLFMGARYRSAKITAVSNSASQREYILAQAKKRGLSNIEVITCDVNRLSLEQRFDRVVSIEMFEHVRNYQRLFANISGWLKDDGLLFVHVFCHRYLMYPFEVQDDSDWMSEHFFTGGLMPAADTFMYFQDHLRLEEQWRYSGEHYAKTAEAWLQNLDANRKAVRELFNEVYGAEHAERWVQRWRMFFMACAELFGYRQGSEWLVTHYRFSRR